jgi:hypothetical protein
MMTRATLLSLCLVACPLSLQAQNSIFGTRGIGFPGRSGGARAISLGGGADMFDRGSVLNPALAALFGQVTVGATTGTTFRNLAVADVNASGLMETRFPLMFLGGGIGRSAFSYQVSFATWAERTFDLTTSDTVVVGGAPLAVEDRLISSGGVLDVRGAVGWRGSSKLALGIAVHRLAGSSRVTATRTFDAGEFQPFRDTSAVTYSGTALSGGLLWLPSNYLGFALSGRINSSLNRKLQDGPDVDLTMPASVAAGAWIAITSRLRLTTTARWRSWSRMQDDVADNGTEALDTWEIGSGVELSSGPGGSGKFPLRAGVRYAQLPFSPPLSGSDARPTEWNFSIGTGTPFAANRAVIDVALQRFHRDGVGVRERGWYLTFGITLTPFQ